MYWIVEAKREFAGKVVEVLERLGAKASIEEIERSIAPPPSKELGDWGVPLFKYSKALKVRPNELVEKVAREIRIEWAKRVIPVGGYLNLEIDVEAVAERILREAREESYGEWRVEGRKVVEHTSANPVHPLHIGHVRNMFLGDSLQRILKNYGNEVQTRFYVNDVGRQVVILIYGLLALGKLTPPEGEKPDHWYGKVYSVTNAVIELKGPEREEWIDVARELKERYPEIYSEIEKKLEEKSYEEVNAELSELMKRYEEGDEETKTTFRKVVNDVLKGFRESMSAVRVSVDKWDWESDLIWSGEVKRIIEMAIEKGIAKEKEGALVIEFDDVDEEVRERLRVPRGLEVPPLVLVRRDGTTLYTTRDIAYTIRKFTEFNADQVINVIATEQRLPQIQLRLALWKLGFKEYAENLIHYAYEMVNVPGMKMSGRRGRMVTLDWLVEEAIKRVKPLVEERSVLEGEEREEIARKVAIGAIKFAMVSVSKDKPITFRWEEVLNFERNSAPYLQYTYARTRGILRRVEGASRPDYSRARLHRDLIMQIAEFPEVTWKAAEELAPEKIAVYLLKLADSFNKFYHEHPVASEPDEGYRALKVAIVEAVSNILRRGLNLLGIEAPERM